MVYHRNEDPMKLRRLLPPRQRLFAIGATFVFALGGILPAFAQTQQAPDQLIKRGTPATRENVKILRVEGANIIVAATGGERGVPLSTVSSVVMKAPQEFTDGSQAAVEGDVDKALPLIRGVVDQFKGLPVAWARQALLLLSDLYIAQDKLDEAEKVIAEFQKLYSGANAAMQAAVGSANIALARKDYAKAREILEPIVQKALETLTPAAAVAPAYSQAFYLLGQVAEAEGMYPQALQFYLYTVTIYYHDEKSAAAAQQKADELRKMDSALFLP